MLHKIFAILALISLSGCTVQYKMVGEFDKYNELIVGDLVHNLSIGVAEITAKTEKTGLTCNGRSRVTYIPPFSLGCNGQQGTATLTCSDGRVANANWTASSCTTGFGEGTTTDGNKFRFTFGLTAAEAKQRLAEMRPAAEKRPDLPIYRPQETRRKKGFNTGTGFFVTKNGHLVTNFHVIEKAKKILATVNGKTLPAVLLRADPANDVALLKVDTATNWLPVANKTSMGRADQVFTLGYPDIAVQGQAQKATFGRINALSGIGDDIRFYQIDVPIQPGNSGGPLVSDKGEVVGVVTMTLSAIVSLIEKGTLPQNVNYAVKSDYLVPLLNGVSGWQGSPGPKDRNVKKHVADYESAVSLIIAK